MKMNLTQHKATPEQECLPRTDEQADRIRSLLTFESIPTLAEITQRANALAEIAENAGADEAMIGGAPYLVLALDPALRMKGIQPLYAFSKRISEDVKMSDGSIEKKSIFKHLGFVRF